MIRLRFGHGSERFEVELSPADAKELHAYLAARIAAFPPDPVAQAAQGVDAARVKDASR